MTSLTGILIQGNLIASDLTIDLVSGELKGQLSENFGLSKTQKLEDEIAFAWGEAKDLWNIFKRRLGRDETETATSITREYWAIPLLKLLGYNLVFQPKAEIIEEKTFAISHRVESGENKPPIHIIGCKINIEKSSRTGNSRLSAHGLMQEYLNRTEHLWGIVTNGLCWRLLRDCSLMTRLTYIEFDLEQILNGENFAEFGLFYRLFHRTRLPQGIEDTDECLLEFYHQEALQQGGRVRDRLRDGVEQAIIKLGTGFLQHQQNQSLRQLIEENQLISKDFYRLLLFLIYRLLFLMVAESRDLLLAGEDAENVRIYREYYSIERLRVLAERPSYRREGFQDIWQGLIITFALFNENWRGEVLGLSPLNGDLFGEKTLKILEGCAIDNHDLLVSIRELSLYENKGQLRRVNYGALNVEELGSVYESLLDFTPQFRQQNGVYEFVLVIGSDRKTTGSYYTPPELVAQLIKSALEPVIAEKLRESEKGKLGEALLSLKVCDPACGSGHFLLAAARRIGKELAIIRTGEPQPAPEALRQAIRDVVQHCIYGVDLNPLAVDLCKVALWIEGFCKGLPLNFLDHRIKCGNSLVGVLDISYSHQEWKNCKEQMDEAWIPDGAFKAVTGDDKKLSTLFKNRNKKEKKDIKVGQGSLNFVDVEAERSEYIEKWREFAEIPETTPKEIKQKQSQYQQNHSENNLGWWRDYSACNLWTAAFFMGLTEQNLQLLPTTEALKQLLSGNPVTQRLVDAANKLAEDKRFFHWCLEFPDVFNPPQPPLANGGASRRCFPPISKGGLRGVEDISPITKGGLRGVEDISPITKGGLRGVNGFDCVLGNPPWERIKLQEKEFFASKDADIANAQNKAAREKLIKLLSQNNPKLLQEFEDAKHDADAQSKFIRESGRFPLTAVGDINTYAVFAETTRKLISVNGRVGIIVPTGIATDNTTKDFFGDLIKTQSLASLYDFENREGLFNAVDSRMKFSLLALTGKPIKRGNFAFFLTQAKQLDNQTRLFQLSPQEIALINPNTLTCPVFRTRQDAELTKKIYQYVPVLENEATGVNPWGISFMAMFHMSNDSGLFKNEAGEGLLPLYEGKMVQAYDHRAASVVVNLNNKLRSAQPEDTTLENYMDINYLPNPQFWIDQNEIMNKLNIRHQVNCILGFKSVTSATNERTFICTFLPFCGAGNSLPIIVISNQNKKLHCCLLANFNSLVFDFVARQKVGGVNLNFFIIKQLPIIPPEWYTPEDIEFISSRVLELVYTAYDMKPFAQDMGYDGEPFKWDETRRAILRAELDAKYAKLYGLTRDELRYILDPANIYGAEFPSETFRVLKNKEINKYGEYRTQRLVLEAWDMLGF
ncbi:Eco57I restriction-modification methylase domain-containing protein [Planktothrix agardhii]|uniref:Eco57I restriction-modification methylase domain-containing protein n=1 Tax=Planktothrix agardhii TaxID=1160 RepID=UPI0020A74568|nr:N-6 DNA methylase [Planktothrix agardhii]CAD5984724.1 putative adenine-specific methylase MJECS02 [Planktothrix agardhii]